MDVQLLVPCNQDPCFDFKLLNGDLSTANELNNAVMISLFTDRRAKDDDVLPRGQTDKRGWWADALDGQEIGSRLWLLYDERRLKKTLLRAEEYAKEALNWLVTDKVAKSFNITASMDGRCETLFLSVDLCRPSGQTEQFKYQYVWDSLEPQDCAFTGNVLPIPTPPTTSFKMRLPNPSTSNFTIAVEMLYGNATIDWGDNDQSVTTGGTYTDGNITSGLTHDYHGLTTEVIVAVQGAVKRIKVSGSGITEIIEFDAFEHYMFNLSTLTSVPTDLPISVITTDYMFKDAIVFNQSIDSWDVSLIQTMVYMFYNAKVFNQTLASWVTSSVVSMHGMFRGAKAFNQNIDGWDLIANQSITEMFFQAVAFNQPLNSWDVSNVIGMRGTFFGATIFNQALNNWVTSSVTSMQQLFQSAVAFNQDIDGWDVSNVINMLQMFYNAVVFNSALNSWNVGLVRTMAAMFFNANAFNQSLSNWDVSSVTSRDEMLQMFNGADIFDQDLSMWCVTNIASAPTDFSTGSPLTTPHKPIWGTCP